MSIAEAQREMRAAFLGGFVGQLVAGAIWALSAAVGTWLAPRHGMVLLFLASMLLFPATQVLLRALGRPARLNPGNTLGQLATQVAFTVPVGFVLVAAATLHRESWFFPASLVVVGAHYLPFIFLYGMWQFGVLAGLLVGGGVAIGLYGPAVFGLGGWFGAAVLVGFAFVGRGVALAEERGAAGPTVGAPA